MAEPPQQPRWELLDDWGHWGAMDPSVEGTLEYMFKEGYPEVEVTFGDAVWEMNFITMKQRRFWGAQEYGEPRDIRRIMILQYCTMRPRPDSPVSASEADAPGDAMIDR